MPTEAMPTDVLPCGLSAEIDERGRIHNCSGRFVAFLGAERPDGLVGRAVDELTTGSGRRTVARAVADAAATGVEIGPLDLWFERPGGDTVAARFWVGVDADVDGRFALRGHDLALLDPHERTAALEVALLDRVAAGEALDPVVSDVVQFVQWALPGTVCSVGAVGSDGVIRHRHATSLPAAVSNALDEMAPTDEMALRARSEAGLVVFHELDDLLPLGAGELHERGLGQAWTVRVQHDDAVLGLLVVFVSADARPDGPVVNLLRHAADIAGTAVARDRADRDRRYASLHDPLTDLPNRRLLIERIDQLLPASRRGPGHTAVFMIDLDDFTVANESLSHDAGDRVLVWVAGALAPLVRPGETLGRFGGDTFLLVTNVVGPEQAMARAEEIRALLDTSVVVSGLHVRTAASVGVVLAGPSDDPDTLLRDADAAMHHAKRLGRNQVVLFDETIREEMLQRVSLESALRSGIDRHELEVHYQPILELGGLSVTGVEALVRWRRAGRTELLSPGDFVGVAEDTGLIGAVGVNVLRQAVRTAAELRAGGWPHLLASVNVSPRQLTDHLVGLVAEVLGEAGLDPGGLCLEITETALAQEGADAVVRDLHQLGVRIAIDDFGTGYSSLDHLRRFPIADILKIDATFVADLHRVDAAGRAIVAAAVTLGHSLGMTVTAEGVETVQQLELLRELGCDRGQGFLMSPAVPPGELPGVLGQVVSATGSG